MRQINRFNFSDKIRTRLGLEFFWAILFLALNILTLLAEEAGVDHSGESQFLDADGWRLAMKGDSSWSWAPQKIFTPKPEFKNEWWYFTGHLQTESGEWLGYQVTFFRIGLRPVSESTMETLAFQKSGTASGSSINEKNAPSRWRANAAWMVHFAVSDPAREKYHHASRITRGVPGAVGWIPINGDDRAFETPLSLAVGDWTLELMLPEAKNEPVYWQMRLASSEVELDLQCDLTLASLQGGDGVSQKADGAGRASYYFSFPRMPTRGSVKKANGQSESVTGWTWFDREVGSNQLSKNQLGWDWFAIQLETGDCLMLYQMRTLDGKVDPNSHGTWIPAKANQPLTRAEWESGNWIHKEAQELWLKDYRLNPVRRWMPSDVNAGVVGEGVQGYPVEWEIKVPAQDLTLNLQALFDEQEFGGGGADVVRYWEGAHSVSGTWQGKPISGRAYVELTGYLGALEGLQGR